MHHLVFIRPDSCLNNDNVVDDNDDVYDSDMGFSDSYRAHLYLSQVNNHRIQFHGNDEQAACGLICVDITHIPVIV